MGETEPEPEGQPTTDPSVYHEDVEPGSVGEPTEEPRPTPGPPDIYGDDAAAEEPPAEEPPA